MALGPKASPASTDADARRVTILGSTGSVGCNTVELVLANRGIYKVAALTAHRNAALLAAQARSLGAELAVIADAKFYGELKEELAGSDVEAAAGPQALVEAASRPVDWVMAAIVGSAGLEATLAAIRQGAIVALANKECLVSAGAVMMAEIRKSGATLLPVDSEHSAIFQVFDFAQREAIERIILTASGGPFRSLGLDEMARVTADQAVAHPNWDMGAKISVDSATMMNKGLELIEAHYLFDLPEERIDILIHPQSIVHSLVSYKDGSVLAQMGAPDMRTPIAYALGWPERVATPVDRLDLATVGQLNFEAPDAKRFPAPELARSVLNAGDAAPTILNAVNEIAVTAFLSGEIGFLDIVPVAERVLENFAAPVPATVADVLAVDTAARVEARRIIADRQPAKAVGRAT